MPKCKHEDCTTIASYGPVNAEKSAIYCKKHIPEGQEDFFEDVVSKRCIRDGCKAGPSFGKIGGKQSDAIYCKKHIPEGQEDSFEDVKNKRCKGDGCKASPSYGPIDGKKSDAIYCKKHLPKVPKGQEDSFEDVINKRCIGEDGCKPCKGRPSYGPMNGKRSDAIYCKKHIPKGQEDSFEDVLSKRCKEDGCKAGPNFGKIGGKKSDAIYCKKHIPKGQEDSFENVVSKRCIGDGCKGYRIFGPIDGKKSDAKFCKKHIPQGQEASFENVISERCVNDWCRIFVSNEKYKGYCLRCFAYEFPLEKVSRNYKTKESLAVQEISKMLNCDEFQHLSPTFDKCVQGGCSGRRPDVAIDVWTHVVIVEIDENGHNTEEYCSCENKRCMQLFIDFNKRPIVFVRFNPDGYTNAKGEKIKSCFGVTKKTGLLKVTNEKMWKERIEVLLNRIRLHLDCENYLPRREMDSELLYYDGFH